MKYYTALRGNGIQDGVRYPMILPMSARMRAFLGVSFTLLKNGPGLCLMTEKQLGNNGEQNMRTAILLASLLLTACHGVETQTFNLPDGTQHVDVTVFNKDLIGPNTQVSTTYLCSPACYVLGNEQASGAGIVDLVPAVVVGGALGVVAASKLRPDTTDVSGTSGASSTSNAAIDVNKPHDKKRHEKHDR
jgi:hypothetical protein